MPLYEFRADDGEITEIIYTMAKAPKIGQTVSVDGKRFTRVFSDVTIADQPNKRKYPYVSNQLSPNTYGAKNVRERKKTKDGRAYWTRGKPLIRSRKHEREVQARNNMDKH